MYVYDVDVHLICLLSSHNIFRLNIINWQSRRKLSPSDNNMLVPIHIFYSIFFSGV